jgi:hypothetical protein
MGTAFWSYFVGRLCLNMALFLCELCFQVCKSAPLELSNPVLAVPGSSEQDGLLDFPATCSFGSVGHWCEMKVSHFHQVACLCENKHCL